MTDISKFLRVLTEEEIIERNERMYNRAKNIPERMSYWLPEVSKKDFLKIPETQIVQFSKKQFEDLIKDSEHEEVITALQSFFEKEVKLTGDLFIKTGNFSNKFDFKVPMLKDFSKAGEQFFSMYYTSLMFGVPLTAEAVFRELIECKGVPTIYEGMPLNTEFRVFYDFDEKKVIGVSNYWHPDVMKNGLGTQEDLETYIKEEARIIEEFNIHKADVMEKVSKQVTDANLTGKWSIDVMYANEEFYLIDMARMESSALIAQMEKVEE